MTQSANVAPTAEQFPKLSIRNRDAVLAAQKCGCYFCLRVTTPTAIQEWADDGATALCPQCGIDALLPGVTDKAALLAGLERWFTAVRVQRKKAAEGAPQ
jgi:hypothetical protein